MLIYTLTQKIFNNLKWSKPNRFYITTSGQVFIDGSIISLDIIDRNISRPLGFINVR